MEGRRSGSGLVSGVLSLVLASASACLLTACPKKAAPTADAAAEAAAPEVDAAAEAAAEAPPPVDSSAAPLDAPDAATATKPTGPVSPIAVGQTWTGTYTCAKTVNMTIRITKVAGTAVSAILDFKPDERKGGSYSMSGTYTPADRKLFLKAGEWIVQSTAGTRVNLDGNIMGDNKTYTGKTIGTNCTTFSARR